jgi:hypothetical protein
MLQLKRWTDKTDTASHRDSRGQATAVIEVQTFATLGLKHESIEFGI